MSTITQTAKPYPAQQWRMPPLSTVFLCDDGRYRTLGEMLDGVLEDDMPKSDQDLLMLLEARGCDWTSPIVSYSFMQRDEAIAKLDDPNRYRRVVEGFAGIADMRWTYDYLVNETIGEFVQTHLPDARDWMMSTYSVTSLDGNSGHAYRIEADIPTSTYECWLSFEIAIPTYETEPMVLLFNAVRSGKDGDEDTTYACEGLDGEWRETESEEGE